MPFLPPPTSAAWLHQDARSGFEVVHLRSVDDGHLLRGTTAAVEDGQAWVVGYEIRLDPGWRTRSAQVTGRSDTGLRTRLLEADGEGRWRIDGEPAPLLDGCLDVDLESSAMTNALPVHRLALPVGAATHAPAAYVRALDLDVERLEQEYTRISDRDGRQRYEYSAPAFDFSCRLVYDEAGLVLAYPGIAVRAG
ncbi:putative glycolipid-binding domain-containing protein [Modestobacter excelsi]|uniref:putative glycolipid-binding domain-containing protein n=1 Tax=Modestobacter excelsi TaxID=2213161 RepID=UPI00110C8E6B|nr:putative glycolipid-binding domain-containing protein [Modestobacter excelsi]